MGRRRKTRNRTRVFVVQDKSGSMSARRAETISGFNEYVDALDQSGSDIKLSLIQFDTKVSTVYSDKSIEDVPDMTEDDFIPGGMTALRDGVGRAIMAAERTASPGDKVIVVIMTDGGENSSTEYSHEDILRHIEGKRKDKWEFVFLGAGEEAWNAGALLGIQASHTINYGVKDKQDHLRAFNYLAASTTSYATATADSAAFDPESKAWIENKAKAENK